MPGIWVRLGGPLTVGYVNDQTQHASPDDASASLPSKQVQAGRRSWFGLLVVLGPVLLVSMDGSILFLAMPTVTHALAPTADEALWILDVYGFATGSLLIAFGNRGVRFGRRKLLLIGVAVFGLGSAAFAPSPEWLIGARAVMGLGGATLLPSGLAVLSELFENSRQRSQAIGIFAAAFATVSRSAQSSAGCC